MFRRTAENTPAGIAMTRATSTASHGQLDRDRQLPRHGLHHGLARADRLAEVAAQREPDPAEVLDDDGVVQAVLLADLLEPGGVGVGPGHHAGGVAGNQTHAGEDDQADHEAA